MGRHNRRTELTATERERFLAAATAFHASLIPLQMALKTTSRHYRLTRDLHCELVETVREITGKDPPWMQRGTGLMG